MKSKKVRKIAMRTQKAKPKPKKVKIEEEDDDDDDGMPSINIGGEKISVGSMSTEDDI